MIFIEAEEWLPDVLEEHLDELAALWSRRKFALEGSDSPLEHLTAIDRRIEAHADALELSGAYGVPLLLEGLEQRTEADRVWASAYALYRMPSSERTRMALIETLEDEDSEIVDAAVTALCFGRIEGL